MMQTQRVQDEKCACEAAPLLIFPCSGASDVGGIADQAARELTGRGVGKMYCLAGIGGRVSGILKTTEAAAGILAIDGCPLGCARKTLEQAGFDDIVHLEVTALGFEKGAVGFDDEAVRTVADAGGALLAATRKECCPS